MPWSPWFQDTYYIGGVPVYEVSMEGSGVSIKPQLQEDPDHDYPGWLATWQDIVNGNVEQMESTGWVGHHKVEGYATGLGIFGPSPDFFSHEIYLEIRQSFWQLDFSSGLSYLETEWPDAIVDPDTGDYWENVKLDGEGRPTVEYDGTEVEVVSAEAGAKITFHTGGGWSAIIKAIPDTYKVDLSELDVNTYANGAYGYFTPDGAGELPSVLSREADDDSPTYTVGSVSDPYSIIDDIGRMSFLGIFDEFAPDPPAQPAHGIGVLNYANFSNLGTLDFYARWFVRTPPYRYRINGVLRFNQRDDQDGVTHKSPRLQARNAGQNQMRIGSRNNYV